ncbi:SRPBCC domain-containing protein [Leucobacter musarum]|uniref:SRPBCC domain-containing protein n=1 Tax=Leucobacter musarum TaxID=1930747 RepID=UPI0006A77944|nr:SRPBCC domain-containing protein [Leucobacter musarum]
MPFTPFDAELDLEVSRIIRAPRAVVWRAWSDPERLAQWWIPGPITTRIDRLELVPGGGFVIRMSEDGTTFVPHMSAVFLAAETARRIVFTNAIDAEWRPVAPAPIALTAEFTFTDHPEGTEYRAIARHVTAQDRQTHADLGFTEGWTAATEGLASIAEGEASGA